MAPKPEKSESGSISCKHGTEGLHGKNNWSVPTFFRSGRIFSCSVNGAFKFDVPADTPISPDLYIKHEVRDRRELEASEARVF